MIQEIRAEFKQLFIERDELIDVALTALISRQHLLIVGPPGTAKSMLAHELCRRIAGAEYFQWLLTKFSTPEELFGPVSLRGLENDEYYRITRGKLPEAHIAFLDEIFKASSSILNTLLTLVNERRYFNGNRVVDCPLSSLFASTNETHDGEELGALYDRFLFRFRVGYLVNEENFKNLLRTEQPVAVTTITLNDLEALQRRSDSIAVGGEIIQAMAALRKSLSALEITVSDRRYRQSLAALRAYALLMGRNRVELQDFAILRHILWAEWDEFSAVSAAIDAITSPVEARLDKFTHQADEIRRYLEETYFGADEVERVTDEARFKVRELQRRLKILMGDERARNSPQISEGFEKFDRATAAIETKCALLLDGAA